MPPLFRLALTWWLDWLAAMLYPTEVALGLDDVKKKGGDDERDHDHD